ncbi:hypothetical protein BLNAU_14911 [Blattamonas nauphoetae]|uniref:Uncharacterized protein n=1 Tax=Blattamonas nauphoetae TaxID=2049346 RepID=A0ABQ9XGY3_9EUKA|nr:hypothetical protein BLNAU_14911 [Blattamonas nauphoetae]
MMTLDTKTSPSTDSPCSDCIPFLNWRKSIRRQTTHDKAVVFQSLIATVKMQSVLDDSLEAKAVTFLRSVVLEDMDSVDAFLNTIASSTDEFSTDFVQSIVVLISTPSHLIISTTMKILEDLFSLSSLHVRLALVKADLIPRLIITLNPLSLSFVETGNIHVHLLKIIEISLLLSISDTVAHVANRDRNEQLAAHETVLKQVLAPCEPYFCYLCVNRYFIVDGEQSYNFLVLLTRLLRISPFYQPTMDFIVNMPVVLTIPSYLTFIKNDYSIWLFLCDKVNARREWNRPRGDQRQMENEVDRMLRMEGLEDVIEEKMQNSKNGYEGEFIISTSIVWNNMQGMNSREFDFRPF